MKYYEIMSLGLGLLFLNKPFHKERVRLITINSTFELDVNVSRKFIFLWITFSRVLKKTI